MPISASPLATTSATRRPSTVLSFNCSAMPSRSISFAAMMPLAPVHAADQRHPVRCRRRLQGYVDFAVGVLAVSKQPDAAPIVGGPGLATTHRRPRHDRNDFGDQGTGS